ncbi:MAG: beta-N-acetylhexosaminidase [Alphaproteobacteria bacterium]
MVNQNICDSAAVVFGCAGTRLSDEERDFFAEVRPLGFILFARNCETPGQVRELIESLRRSVGRADAPVLIDQEGGRVARLKPPHWRAAPAAARFGELAARDPAAGREAARLNARLIAAELDDLGITIDCAPLLDVPAPGAHDVIGDRAFSDDSDVVTTLGGEVVGAMLAGGVLPVIKHMPGHGRARADSHDALPRVAAPIEALRARDFVPFRALRGTPWGMTAHVVFEAIDDAPATVSRRVIGAVIRGEIGFDGVLASDDLSMAALSGDLDARAAAALAAGCDVVLHCNGRFEEMRAVAAGVRPLDEAAQARLAKAAVMRRPPEPFDRAAALARLDALLAAL